MGSADSPAVPQRQTAGGARDHEKSSVLPEKSCVAYGSEKKIVRGQSGSHAQPPGFPRRSVQALLQSPDRGQELAMNAGGSIAHAIPAKPAPTPGASRTRLLLE